MKVLMIITVDLGKNGISTCVLNYCSELIRYGAEMHILAPNHVENGLKERLGKQGIKLHEIMFRNSNTTKYFLQVFKLIKKEKYDVALILLNSGADFSSPIYNSVDRHGRPTVPVKLPEALRDAMIDLWTIKYYRKRKLIKFL